MPALGLSIIFMLVVIRIEGRNTPEVKNMIIFQAQTPSQGVMGVEYIGYSRAKKLKLHAYDK